MAHGPRRPRPAHTHPQTQRFKPSTVLFWLAVAFFLFAAFAPGPARRLLDNVIGVFVGALGTSGAYLIGICIALFAIWLMLRPYLSGKKSTKKNGH